MSAITKNPAKRPAEAQVYAFKVTIICPKCDEPAKAADSGITWTSIPQTIHCEKCGKVSRVAKTIRRE